MTGWKGGKNTLKENPTERRTEGGDGEDVSPPSPALSFAKQLGQLIKL